MDPSYTPRFACLGWRNLRDDFPVSLSGWFNSSSELVRDWPGSMSTSSELDLSHSKHRHRKGEPARLGDPQWEESKRASASLLSLPPSLFTP